MKKFTLIICLVALIALSASGTAYAAYVKDSKDFGSSTTTTYKTSKNVYMDYSSLSSGGIGVAYTLGTYHSSGSRTIGSGSFDQKLYYNDTFAYFMINISKQLILKISIRYNVNIY